MSTNGDQGGLRCAEWDGISAASEVVVDSESLGRPERDQPLVDLHEISKQRDPCLNTDMSM